MNIPIPHPFNCDSVQGQLARLPDDNSLKSLGREALATLQTAAANGRRPSQWNADATIAVHRFALRVGQDGPRVNVSATIDRQGNSGVELIAMALAVPSENKLHLFGDIAPSRDVNRDHNALDQDTADWVSDVRDAPLADFPLTLSLRADGTAMHEWTFHLGEADESTASAFFNQDGKMLGLAITSNNEKFDRIQLGEAPVTSQPPAGPERHPLPEPERGWKTWVENLRTIGGYDTEAGTGKVYKSVAQDFGPALQTGVPVQALQKLSPTAKQVLLKSLANGRRQDVATANMSDQNLDTAIGEYAINGRIPLSLGMAAILPPIFIRDLLMEHFYPGKSVAQLDAQATARHLYRLRVIPQLLLVVAAELRRLDGDFPSRPSHAVGLGKVPPKPFDLSDSFHVSLFAMWSKISSSTEPITLFWEMERFMDLWAESPLLGLSATTENIKALYETEDLKQKLAYGGQANCLGPATEGFINWLVTVLPAEQARYQAQAAPAAAGTSSSKRRRDESRSPSPPAPPAPPAERADASGSQPLGRT